MTAVSSVYAQRLLMTLFLVSFGIYMFLATVTYTPFDPGWMHISSDTQQVSNASGIAGAWIADLLFGFLGWASLLIPIFLFIEAIQVWWPRSFLNRPFRYAAQFFLILVVSSLLYLHWNVPADTLDNAAGGIIGYELGQSLSQLLTIYGATLFLLVFGVVLFTLAFGVQWSKTWVTLKATPSYLQDLFYKNVSPNESDYDLTTQPATKAAAVKVADNVETNANASDEKEASVQPESTQPQSTTTRHDAVAERLFADVLAKEQSRPEPVADTPVANTQNFEHTLEQAHKLERDSQRLVATGEVWRALQRDDASHKQEIDALLRAADDSTETEQVPTHEQFQQTISQVNQNQPSSKQDLHGLDWNDDEIFDELLAAVPNSKTATDVHTPFVQDHHVEAEPTSQSVNIANETSSNISNLNQSPKNLANEQVFEDFDDLLIDEDIAPTEPVRASSYAQSSAFVKAPIQTTIQADKLSKEEFIEAWQETAGKPQENADFDEDDFDFDAPLTDASGRPMSRAMQVAKKRLDLPTLPGLDLLDKVDPNKKVNFTEEQLSRLSELLEIKLQEFNVKAQVVEAQPGPVVTRFELDLAPGVKASKVTNISRDLARSMSMASVRVVEVIPGKPYIGIEVPNSAREMVRLIELLETPTYRDPSALISMAMGKDISGNPVLTDLAKAPHMLVAGTTGSGKSVAVNSMILSMLLKYTPDQLRLILIDPKQLELANYNDIPHLLTPVVTDMKDAVSALNWCVNEMERRYKLMSFLKIRKLSDYNRKVEEAIANGEDLIDPTWKPSDSATQERAPRLTPLPSIVIVADEFADMIMQVGKKAEEMITRLAQKSRAAGIHLLLATQRPSVDVITGLIKANIPTRVALRVNSKIDSRTILDAGGAEDLLGHGDMLFLGPGKIEPERVHGAFISDDEVNRICDAWRERGEPDYIDEILTPFDEEPASRGFEEGEGGSDRDALYDQCVSFVLETRKASTSSLQRKFSLGYNRAARIIDQMEENGIVSSMGPNGKRDILV
ncbi:DNA translocase FtsK 4TM domain-containing protein [Acinetobacter pittii]|uniref:DNA translocase FtsK n=2 Tax=Acinetobacter TaxID=469 RepID=A0A1C2U4R1_ACIPI|nr:MULTISPECIES: DNA translocase FtsK [Acinetobacter]MDU6284469.1 DNA translocase FtsK 4TM domain-containing protein [Acinetobacter sp.]AMM28695.1 cell division protein FstK [Acinetobacter pittii]EXA94148.1 ftsK/SpoIIIE family protein [Acinetobacter sp. 1295259]KQE20562.1 cell division protein FstK [Acinetobacter pittii]KQF21097.1 cell division protein FstK [Acinetobacter pittii]